LLGLKQGPFERIFAVPHIFLPASRFEKSTLDVNFSQSCNQKQQKVVKGGWLDIVIKPQSSWEQFCASNQLQIFSVLFGIF